MKKIVTIAAVAALATLSACNKADPAATESNEAVATEAVANDSVAAEADLGKPADEHVEATAPAADSK